MRTHEARRVVEHLHFSGRTHPTLSMSRKHKMIGVDSARSNCCRYSPPAMTGPLRVHKATVSLHEQPHACSRPRESLPIGGGRRHGDLCGMLGVELEYLAEDVGKPVIAVETLQHAERASELDLFDHQRVHRVCLWFCQASREL